MEQGWEARVSGDCHAPKGARNDGLERVTGGIYKEAAYMCAICARRRKVTRFVTFAALGYHRLAN